jgi:tetratricopeptide (TPR) repeat protein
MAMADAKPGEQLDEMAREIAALKARLDRPESSVERCLRISRESWLPATFAVTLVSAIYVYYKYEVNYFESYANISTTKKLSDFYSKLGNRMMLTFEWEAAEHAYNAALKLNPNNIDATYGVAKAQVFLPLPGRTYLPPEIVDARLEALSSALPDDANVDLLKAIRYYSQGDVENSALWHRKCITRNPPLAACYFQLGYIDMGAGRFSSAAANVKEVIKLEPGWAAARNNLGFIRLVLGEFKEAIELLDQAYRTSPSMVTGINLGDAYRFSGDVIFARTNHQLVLDTASNPTGPDDRYSGGEWTYNFMPVERGDVETIKRFMYCRSLEEKMAVAHAALSIDLAALGDFQGAAEHFEKSLKLNGSTVFKQFFHNKILSTVNLVSPPDDAKTWLAERGKLLE